MHLSLSMRFWGCWEIGSTRLGIGLRLWFHVWLVGKGSWRGSFSHMRSAASLLLHMLSGAEHELNCPSEGCDGLTMNVSR